MSINAVLLGSPYSYFADANGAPLAGGKIFTYAAGTTTPQATYTDASAVTPLSNPVILDSAGRATIWMFGIYKVVVKDALDNVIATADSITGITGLGMEAATYDPALIGEQIVGITAVQTVSNKTLVTPNIVGITTASNAALGSVGQLFSSTVASGAAVSLTTGVAANVTTFALPAGDWDVWGSVGLLAGASTTITLLAGSVSLVSATMADISSGSAFVLAASFTNGVTNVFPVGMTRINVATTTNIFLVAQASFGVSTMKGYGGLFARRVR